MSNEPGRPRGYSTSGREPKMHSDHGESTSGLYPPEVAQRRAAQIISDVDPLGPIYPHGAHPLLRFFEGFEQLSQGRRLLGAVMHAGPQVRRNSPSVTETTGLKTAAAGCEACAARKNPGLPVLRVGDKVEVVGPELGVRRLYRVTGLGSFELLDVGEGPLSAHAAQEM